MNTISEDADDVPDGTYRGQWSRDLVTFKVKGNVIRLYTVDFVSGINIKIRFRVERGAIVESSIERL